MIINKQALLDNGWGVALDGRLVKPLRADGSLRLWVMTEYTFIVHLQCYEHSYALPHVDALEKLSQLERFLSPWLVMDTAPLDTAIRARFAEGGGSE